MKAAKMKKLHITVLLISLILYSGCAPRFANQQSATRSQKKIIEKFLKRLQEIERENSDFHLRKLFYPIRAYIGTPYKFGGDTRRGIDCSGFVCKVFQESFNIKLPHNASQQYVRCTKISSSDLRLGDLVFFSINQSGSIGHIGIYLGKNYFAHASTSSGVIVSKLTENYYRSRYVGAGRILD